MDEIPGPKPYPFIGNVLQMDMTKVFVQFASFAQHYGGIFKVKLFNKSIVVVNNPSFIHDVLIKQSAEFAGRPYSYRNMVNTHDFSGVVFTDPGPQHRGRRKALQKYLKQYGSGIQRIENITQTATDDLIKTLMDQHGRPIDPQEVLNNYMADVITILLCGETISREEIKEITNDIHQSLEALGPGMGVFLDWFPFLRFFGNITYKQLRRVTDTQLSFIGKWMKQNPRDGFINVIQSMSEEEKMASYLDSEKAQTATSWTLFLAGMLTTSTKLNMSDECPEPLPRCPKEAPE